MIGPILRGADPADFERATACDGGTVRDVMAHCAAALTRTASGDVHDFSPASNQADVDARRHLTVGDVLAELLRGYEDAAVAIDKAGGVLDGVGLGEWMHGGDIREALGLAGAYASEGIDLALGLLVERSRRMEKPGVRVRLPGGDLEFGTGRLAGMVTTDRETFVRICGGRTPDPARFYNEGDVAIAAMVLFS